jgi:hypothetical protein
MFIYPSDVILKLRTKWSSSFTKDNNSYWNLPNDKILHLLVETAYHSTFLTEENRKISFKLIYITMNSGDSLNKAPIEIKRRLAKIVIFDVARAFNTNEILRLSPSTDFNQSLICIDNFGTDNQPKLMIWGLMDGGTSWWNNLHGKSMLGLPLIKKLIIASMEPGHITISRGENVLLTLNNGEFKDNDSNVFNTTQIKSFFRKTISDFNREILLNVNDDSIKKIDKKNFNDKYFNFIKSLIFHIQEKFHGGVLIIIKDDLQSINENISFKYKSNYDVVWELLVKREKAFNDYQWLNNYLRNNDDAKRFVLYSSLETQIKEYDEAILDSIKFFSSLSNIDGSIVVTDKLRLLGFGGEIILEKSKFTILDAVTGEIILLDNYGTRHRSTFRLCHSLKNTIAFIISQDGNIKVVKKDNNDLLIWSNINLGFFGI